MREALEQIAKARIFCGRHVQLACELFGFELSLRLARERFEHAFDEVFLCQDEWLSFSLPQVNGGSVAIIICLNALPIL